MLKGIAASAGAAVAELFRLSAPDLSVDSTACYEPGSERERYESAAETALGELDALYDMAMETDEATAQVFDIHRMMLDDPDFCDGIEDGISAGHCAEFAVQQTADTLAGMFLAMEGDEYMQARAADVRDVAGRLIRVLKGISAGHCAEFAVQQTADTLAGMFLAMEGDEYMQARAADVRDVAGRLIRVLKGISEGGEHFEHPVIVAAEDLLPSQTVRLDKTKVLGFVTKYGSVTSHSVILAKTLGIPCIVGMGSDFDALPEKCTIAIDGSTGEVLPDPDAAAVADFNARAASFKAQQAELAQYKDRKAVTKSGHEVLVVANIGSLDDIDAVISSGADGVGLFRSEFIYLNSEDFPDEETQFNIYKEVLSRLAPRPVVIRTLDLGSDKQAPYFGIDNEDNPAMGYRAIRICLKEPYIFRAQLRALLRASVYGNLNVMFPMISRLDQVRQIKEIVAGLKAELDAEGIAYSDSIQFGIMVETPAAAVMSDVLAKEVDFFSLGTNDLTQYTMAVDRMNARVSDLFDSADPAILRLIELTAKNAHDAGIWVGICGESAANTALTDFYMSVGIDELSVSPSSVAAVKRAVLES